MLNAIRRQLNSRFALSVLHKTGVSASGLREDVNSGLSSIPKHLSSKYFYDSHGSELFDDICDLPEYYQTRTEQELLEDYAPEILQRTSSAELVELGSGASRKTRTLLSALSQATSEPTYVPIDISYDMLVASSRDLLRDFASLRVHGIVADYDHHLGHLPQGRGNRLFAFLGSTIGNFSEPAAVGFLSTLAKSMAPSDRLLLGIDLVKSHRVLHAAYNDASGVTAAFNLNILRVINRELGADFALDGFEHVARYLPETERIEMYLYSQRAQRVDVEALGRSFVFGAGERVRTEISRKFSKRSAEIMCTSAGLSPVEWYVAPNDYYAIVLLQPALETRLN